MMRRLHSIGLVILSTSAIALLASAQEQKKETERAVELSATSSTYVHAVDTWLEPMPGVRARVSLPDPTGGSSPLKPLEKLSVDQLHQRYVRFKRLIQDAYVKSSIDVPQMEKWKKELVLTFVALRDRGSATREETDETWSIALERPSIAWEVTSNSSYTRLLTGAIEGKLLTGHKLVTDSRSGLALGFLEAEPLEPVSEAEPGGQAITIVRRFTKALDQSLPASKQRYEIVMRADPPNFNGASGHFQIESQPIAENGVIEDRVWNYQFQAQKGFQEAQVAFTAELRSYDDEIARAKGNPSHSENIRIPLERVTIRKKPNALWLGFLSAVHMGKELFGFVGGVPTAILGWIGLVKPLRRRRQQTADHATKEEGSSQAAHAGHEGETQKSGASK